MCNFPKKCQKKLEKIENWGVTPAIFAHSQGRQLSVFLTSSFFVIVFCLVFILFLRGIYCSFIWCFLFLLLWCLYGLYCFFIWFYYIFLQQRSLCAANFEATSYTLKNMMYTRLLRSELALSHKSLKRYTAITAGGLLNCKIRPQHSREQSFQSFITLGSDIRYRIEHPRCTRPCRKPCA